MLQCRQRVVRRIHKYNTETSLLSNHPTINNSLLQVLGAAYRIAAAAMLLRNPAVHSRGPSTIRTTTLDALDQRSGCIASSLDCAGCRRGLVDCCNTGLLFFCCCCCCWCLWSRGVFVCPRDKDKSTYPSHRLHFWQFYEERWHNHLSNQVKNGFRNLGMDRTQQSPICLKCIVD